MYMLQEGGVHSFGQPVETVMVTIHTPLYSKAKDELQLCQPDWDCQ